ncbi:MAG: endonuclease/exonuclease/phosphatase family protein [Myxococcota bacterium]|nr:endonuclease/exonuclease/phosphatase family protein [Myxococcota bacterium]
MTLAVLSLNLWHDSGPWAARAERIRDWLDRLDPDVAGFQEVLRSDHFDQLAELLEDRLPHRDYVAASPIGRGDREHEFGNAIASRWPITARHPLSLPDRGDGETRAALSVEIDAPFGALGFTCTHLNWRLHHGDTRERQAHAVALQAIGLRPKGGFPPILVGDFNAEPDADEIRFLTGGHAVAGKSVYFHDAWRVAGEGGDGLTWSNRNPWARANLEPERRIDYVFSGYPTRQGLGLVERCRVVCDDEKDGVWPSDHFGVFATFRTEPLVG